MNTSDEELQALLLPNSAQSLAPPSEARRGRFAYDRWVLSHRIADINGDRRADLPSEEDFNNSQQYMSRGDGTFDRVTETNSGWTNENGMGFEIGDYDNGGDLDIFNVNNKDDATLPVQVPCPAATSRNSGS